MDNSAVFNCFILEPLMPDSQFYEESFFFLHIDSVCRSPAITCAPDISVSEAAQQMSEQNIAGLVIADKGTPLGILSVRHLRDLIAKTKGNLAGHKVCEIMQTGVTTVRHKAYVFEAIFKMAKNNSLANFGA